MLRGALEARRRLSRSARRPLAYAERTLRQLTLNPDVGALRGAGGRGRLATARQREEQCACEREAAACHAEGLR